MSTRKATGVSQRHGRGCVGKAGCGCPWAWWLELPADADGKRQQFSKSGYRTQRDAKDARAELKAKHKDGLVSTSPKTVFRDYLEQWYATKAKTLRATTLRSYGHHLDTYLLPHLGAIRLAELRPAHIDRMFDVIERDYPRVSSATRGRIFATLRSALASAVRKDLISVNPCSRVEVPRGGKYHLRPWQPEQVIQFLDHPTVRKHRLWPMLFLIVEAGLRRGEAVGVRWSDLDLDQGRLTVRQQIVQVGHALQTGPPKTDAGEGREVDLDPDTVAVLRSWKAQQAAERLAWGEGWEGTDRPDEGLVFTRETGRGWHPEYVTKAFGRLCKAADVPVIRLHDLRHGSASLALAAGVPLAVVSKRLGHSSIVITADLYSHLIGDANKDAAVATQGLLRKYRASGQQHSG